MKLKIVGQPHEEVLMTTDSRYKHYKANEDRINPKDGLMLRKYFGEIGFVKYYQILSLRQLVNKFSATYMEKLENTRNRQNKNCLQRKLFFPKNGAINQGVDHVMWSMYQRITDFSSLSHPPLQNPNQQIIAPEDAMQIDLVPELSATGGYEFIVTVMDVFSH